MDRNEIEALLNSRSRQLSPKAKVVDDTSHYMRLDQGDVMLLAGTPHLITRNERETGFGMDDDPKYWVKRTIDLQTGESKIVKLVFFEEFTQQIGETPVLFFRSPEKEAKVLDLVTGHKHFMQGFAIQDTAGNNVRIIDFIQGTSLNKQVTSIPMDHRRYFETRLPELIGKVCDCVLSLSLLHENGLVHGDVRWDHVYWDRELKIYRWIDFDYNYNFPEKPWGADLFGLGKILAYLIGKGPLLFSDILQRPDLSDAVDDLVSEDFSIVEQGRLMNLQKLYPYIPDALNNILLHFSGHAEIFYETVQELVDDLRHAIRTSLL